MIQHPKRVGYAYHIMKLSTKILVKVILHNNVLFTYDTDISQSGHQEDISLQHIFT